MALAVPDDPRHLLSLAPFILGTLLSPAPFIPVTIVFQKFHTSNLWLRIAANSRPTFLPAQLQISVVNPGARDGISTTQ